jgi:hypothetical protein
LIAVTLVDEFGKTPADAGVFYAPDRGLFSRRMFGGAMIPCIT